MKRETLMMRWKSRLRDNLAETERQMSVAGVRFRVFARLQELERERKYIARKLIKIDPDSEAQYAQYLIGGR